MVIPLLNETMWSIKPGSRELPLIIAHRGDVEAAPENTLEAFQLAVANGADGVELDVRLTKDKKVAVLHDRHVDRTTSGHGPVGAFTVNELKALDAGSWFDPTFKTSHVPTLDEVFELLPPPFLVDIELKVRGWGVHSLASEVVAVIKRFDRLQSTMVASFNPMALFAVKSMEPRIQRGYIWSAHHPLPIRDRWLSPLAKADWMAPDLRTTTPSLLRHFHQQGKPVLAWDLDVHQTLHPLDGIRLDALVTNSLRTLVSQRT